ncbi:MAG: HEPN domain-containing protein [Candidatus Woesearchaeota archaeon]
MKEFEFFLNKGDVKKQSSDKNLSMATFKDSIERLDLSKNLFKKQKPKYVLENAYEAMREAADSLLYLEGYKSYSHEASIIYLLKKGFNMQEIKQFDRFRKIRNGIKYYGGDCDEYDAETAIELAEIIINKIKKILNEIKEK